MSRFFLRYLVVLMMVCGMTAYAEETVTSGFVGNYIGMQMGGTRLHVSNEYLKDNAGHYVLTRPSNNGFGLRLFWGYQFIDYLGVEGGYGYYSPAVYNIPAGNSPELRMQALDFVGKGVLPLFKGLSIFGKGGAALVFYKEGGLLAPNPKGGKEGSNSVTVRPEVGVGASYAFTPNWSIDATVTRILKGSVIPNSDFYSIGISYHAVDLYCGQFLC